MSIWISTDSQLSVMLRNEASLHNIIMYLKKDARPDDQSDKLRSSA